MAQNLSSNSNLNGIKQMMQMFKMASNPQQYLISMINQNPQMKEVVNFVNQSGKNPKDAFYALAKQRGVDPNEILRQLQI